MKAVFIDVSELAPPEPMVKILTALAQLPHDHYLKINHSRIPFPLFTRLTENNWCYQYSHNSGGGITLYIYHQDAKLSFESIDTDKL
jgi:uncharacterized protein DUF2249